MINMNDKIKQYLNQDIDNPKYLFHGSPHKLDKLVPKKAYDSEENEDNIATAIFLFPSFLKSTPFAFKDTIKENSMDLNWNFEVPTTNDYPLMIMENVNIDENIKGYIYVFEKNNNMFKDENTYQYKCYEELVPLDVIEIYYKDFQGYFECKNCIKIK